jgi:magnesium transporter
MDVETASDVIRDLSDLSREQILEDLPQEKLTQIVDDLPSDEATDLIADLPEERAQVTLDQIEGVDSERVRELLQYDEESAGGIMQKELVAVRSDASVQEAIERIRVLAEEVEDLHQVFVEEKDQTLVGILPLGKLILARPDTLISEIMETHFTSVRPEVDQEEVAKIFRKYDIISLPVVDHYNRLLGRITVDDVVEVIEEEASEDILKMAGTHEDELVYSGDVLRISRYRLPWLLTNLAGGLFTGYLMWLFKVTLKEVFVLIAFVPVIIGMGGNAGIQSSTIMVRGLATGIIDLERLMQLILKEIRVAFIMGGACGIVGGLVALIWQGKIALGIVVGCSMMTAIFVANVMGALFPVLFRRLKIDPAVASGPLVTTANDVTGILIYMGISTLFLKYLL